MTVVEQFTCRRINGDRSLRELLYELHEQFKGLLERVEDGRIAALVAHWDSGTESLAELRKCFARGRQCFTRFPLDDENVFLKGEWKSVPLR